MGVFVVYLMIILGSLLMVTNIIRYDKFIRRSDDVLSSGKKGDRAWTNLAFILLIFFLLGYIGIAVLSDPDYLVGSILFGGSIFVAIVISLIIHLTATIKERSLEIVEALIEVIEARDPNLNGHSVYVQNVTMCLWKYIPNEMKEGISDVSIEYAALLHDVGKLGIPESILNKPGKLNDEEWAVMKEHPRKGVRILKKLKSFDSVLPWIEYHHERIDGKGYYSIPGAEIPFAARVIAVADTYSAITMRRAYKPAKTYEDAITIIKEVAGTQLDAKIVGIFCEIPRAELEECVPVNVDVESIY
ncbi:MAG: HD domain-containing protein [Lachnospiraceae bacterium]|nr:HD domain-containing protein [Lachnospiraceae bacterium]